MLYHLIVPGTAELLHSKDIAFAAMVVNFSSFVCAHVQPPWTSACFDGRLVRDPSRAVTVGDGDSVKGISAMTLDEVQYETVLHSRLGKCRYPNDADSKYPNFIFEAVPYLDMLIADLGLRVFRRRIGPRRCSRLTARRTIETSTTNDERSSIKSLPNRIARRSAGVIAFIENG
jgi:hypothetical protein